MVKIIAILAIVVSLLTLIATILTILSEDIAEALGITPFTKAILLVVSFNVLGASIAVYAWDKDGDY